MVVGINVEVTGARQLNSFMNNLTPTLKREYGTALYNMAKKTKKHLRIETLSDPNKSMERLNAASQIKARKINKFKSVIEMPRSLIYLDSMAPHYISLKMGRAVTKWTRKYYDNSWIKTKGGLIGHGPSIRTGHKSMVRKGPRGGIQPGSFLYVTPHPFIQSAIRKTRKEYPQEIRRTMDKVFKKSRS